MNETKVLPTPSPMPSIPIGDVVNGMIVSAMPEHLSASAHLTIADLIRFSAESYCNSFMSLNDEMTWNVFRTKVEDYSCLLVANHQLRRSMVICDKFVNERVRSGNSFNFAVFFVVSSPREGQGPQYIAFGDQLFLRAVRSGVVLLGRERL